MVGEIVAKNYQLDDVLSEKQVKHIITKFVKDKAWEFVGSELRAATDGIAGFLGDHIRVTLRISTEGNLMDIKLFVKRIPLANQPKADHINKGNYFKRESFVFSLIDDLNVGNDPQPWSTTALLHNESLLVMPDLAVQGYIMRPLLQYLDFPHVLVTVESVARFHADIANYETERAMKGLPWIPQVYPEVLEDPTFKDSPYIRCGAKLTADLLNIFSKEYTDIPDLESKLIKSYIEACNSLKEYNSTLNVLIHKDLWVNNIMYRYEKEVPVNALLVDYQCLRYGPPAFDLMIFLYCTTSRTFREQFERTIFCHYFDVFWKRLGTNSKHRLQRMKYDEKEFLRWCEVSRAFGAAFALAIFPYVLMDPVTAQKTFDDPETYQRYLVEDRSEPVVEYCRRNDIYRQRQVELSEEFVQRFVNM